MRISDWSSDVCSSDLISDIEPVLQKLPIGIYVVDNRWLINPGQLSANPDIDKISADYRMRSYPHPLQSEKIGSHQNGEAATCKYDPDPRERSKARQQSFEPEGQIGRASGRERVCHYE